MQGNNIALFRAWASSSFFTMASFAVLVSSLAAVSSSLSAAAIVYPLAVMAVGMSFLAEFSMVSTSLAHVF